eukprot:TRINITY_DN12046_c0_g1_i1.p1 TRINITY_DN12046_c0_g1~~TRINITY_DN12046_c0_g1_i1.p1  ORF type:complete len:896 (+),score=46.29 TRINITY_DN12046_c0_g1_i1:45-2732(+)
MDSKAWIETYVDFLQKFKYIVALILLGLLALGGVMAPHFANATSQDFEPPSNSRATGARNMLNQYFPLMKQSASIVLFIQLKNTSGNYIEVLSDRLRSFSFAIQKRASEYPSDEGILLNSEGYYTLRRIDFAAAEPFLSSDHCATFISFTIGVQMTSTAATNYAKFLKNEAVPEIQSKTNTLDYEMTLMGSPAFLETMIDSSTSDLERVDSIVLPLALLTLAYILKSLRLLILPLVCLGFSAAGSFGIMYGVATRFSVFAGAPSLMMSILIAMSIDYGLFLLSRYKEELIKQRESGKELDTRLAVITMLHSAGHTITVSGLTLATCFLGLLFFRMSIMRSLGVGCAIVLMTVLLSNLIIVPLLLCWFPRFFQRCLEEGYFCPPRLWCLESKKDKLPRLPSASPHGVAQLPEATLNDDLSTDSRECDDPTLQIGHAIKLAKVPTSVFSADEDSIWYKLGWRVVRFPYNVVVPIVIVLLTLPFDFYAFNYDTTDENLYFLPKHSKVTQAYQRMGSEFGYGQVYAYQILMVPDDPTAKILDKSNNYKLWAQTRDAIFGLVNASANVHGRNFEGPSFAGSPIGGETMATCLDEMDAANVTCVNVLPVDIKCRGNVLLACSFMDTPENLKESHSMWFSYAPSFAPMGKEGSSWLHNARKYADEFNARQNISMYFIGPAADAIDAEDGVNADFTTMVGVTSAVVLCFVAVSFKSITIPLRSILTIGLTVIWVYGFAALVYQHGALTWTTFEGFDNTHAIVYIIPLMTFPIVVGIGLDYDIFLITRIIEYRRSGYSTEEAICQGLAKTGYIITAAGVIMATAFSGLLFSEEPFMHQLSFYMVFAVLFDTFVVRTVFVPALMGMLGEWNWYPFTLRGVIEYTKVDLSDSEGEYVSSGDENEDR